MKIIFLHGWSGSPEYWAAMLKNFSLPLPFTWEAILPTLPGHGEEPSLSSLKIAGMEDLVDHLVRSLMPHLEGPYCLCGYSLGGRIAAAWHARLRGTALAPRGVALISSGGLGEGAGEARRALDNSRAAALVQDPEKFWQEWYGQEIFGSLTPAEIEQRKAEKKRHNRQYLAEVLRVLSPGAPAGAGAEQGYGGREKLTEIEHLLYIAGANDEKYRTLGAKLEAANVNCRFVLIEGAAHSVPIEKPEACARELGEWISALERKQ